jgi:hypothetical protein
MNGKKYTCASCPLPLTSINIHLIQLHATTRLRKNSRLINPILLKIDPKELRLLVLPWSVDLDHVKEFVNSASSKIGVDFKTHIHFKNHTDLNYFRESQENDIFNKIQYSEGALSIEDYI